MPLLILLYIRLIIKSSVALGPNPGNALTPDTVNYALDGRANHGTGPTDPSRHFGRDRRECR
jgi:hypothetical protein